MKQIIIIFAILLYHSIIARSGNITQNGRVWNYCLNVYGLDELIDSYDGGDFRFVGSKEIEGRTYGVFTDDREYNVSYIRQNGGKVYLYLTEDLRQQYLGDEEVFEGEILLYDYSAKEGDTYRSLSFDEVGFDFWTTADVEVKSISEMTVGGEVVVCQSLEYSTDTGHLYEVVEGIGISRGRLDRPQCAYLTSGTRFTYNLLKSVTDQSGEVIFDGNGFMDEPLSIEETIEKQEEIMYSGGVVTAGESDMTICDLSGMTVAAGRGEVSTVGLLPGVYVARAGGKSLKIIVRDR